MGVFKKIVSAVAPNPNAPAPAPKGIIGKAIYGAMSQLKAQENAAAAVAQAIALKKKKEQEEQAAYTQRLRSSAMKTQAMKKGGIAKKKAKPVVKAKARKK